MIIMKEEIIKNPMIIMKDFYDNNEGRNYESLL